MDVDVESVLGLQLQRCLHARIREYRRRRVCGVRFAVLAYHLTYARERRNLILVLLRVVVARNPVGGVVAGHGKLRVLLLYHEVVEVLLLRELVAQAHAVVVDAESNLDVTIARRLVEAYLKFVVVVANCLCLAPNRCPSLVEGRCLRRRFLESVHQVGLLHALRRVLVACKLQSEVRWVNHLLALVAHFVRRTSVVGERERKAHVAVGRSDGLCRCHSRQKRKHGCNTLYVHIVDCYVFRFLFCCKIIYKKCVLLRFGRHSLRLFRANVCNSVHGALLQMLNRLVDMFH